MMKDLILKISRSILIILLLLGIFYAVAPQKDKTLWQGEIKIGVIAPLTGSYQSAGLSMEKGAQLAAQNINNNGGINGYKLNIVVVDDQGTPKMAETAAKELIFIESVKALIGPFSSDCCLAIKGLINVCGIPLITPGAYSDEIITADDFIFRNVLGTSDVLQKLDSFSYPSRSEFLFLEGFGAKTLGIIYQDDILGHEMSEVISDLLEKKKKEDALLFSFPFKLGLKNYDHLFSQISNNFPDLLYIVSTGIESVELVKSARDAGFTGLFIGEGGFNSSLFDQSLKILADGTLFSTQWHPTFSTPMSDVFLKTYMSQYNETPDMFAASSYEAVYILKDSLLRTLHLSWRDDYQRMLRDDLASPRVMNGITGKIFFNHNGQIDRPLFIMQKKWDGHRMQSFILYPTQYSQSNSQWNFGI